MSNVTTCLSWCLCRLKLYDYHAFIHVLGGFWKFRKGEQWCGFMISGLHADPLLYSLFTSSVSLHSSSPPPSFSFCLLLCPIKALALSVIVYLCLSHTPPRQLINSRQLWREASAAWISNGTVDPVIVSGWVYAYHTHTHANVWG